MQIYFNGHNWLERKLNNKNIPYQKLDTKLIHKYLRHDKKFPHVWCPGCGNGIVLGALIRAIDLLGLAKDDIVLASGIGCSGRMPVYVDFNTLHATHGRALTFATGIKLIKPSMTIITVMVSPIARPMPSMIAVSTPDLAAGRVTRQMVCHSVAPMAREASR